MIALLSACHEVAQRILKKSLTQAAKIPGCAKKIRRWLDAIAEAAAVSALLPCDLALLP